MIENKSNIGMMKYFYFNNDTLKVDKQELYNIASRHGLSFNKVASLLLGININLNLKKKEYDEKTGAKTAKPKQTVDVEKPMPAKVVENNAFLRKEVAVQSAVTPAKKKLNGGDTASKKMYPEQWKSVESKRKEQEELRNNKKKYTDMCNNYIKLTDSLAKIETDSEWVKVFDQVVVEYETIRVLEEKTKLPAADLPTLDDSGESVKYIQALLVNNKIYCQISLALKPLLSIKLEERTPEESKKISALLTTIEGMTTRKLKSLFDMSTELVKETSIKA